MLHVRDVKRLYALDAPVLSLYLDVDPGYLQNQAATPAWRIWFRNELRRLEGEIGDRDALRIWQPIRERAEAYIDGYKPESKGLVIFAHSDGLETLHLPLPVENMGGYGQPLVTPLFWKLDEFERYLIVLADQQEARFMTAYLGTVDDQERMEIELDEYDFGQKTINPATSYGKELNQGSNREAFNDMVSEHRNRFLRDVVDHIGQLRETYQTERIILGGAEETAHAIRRLMNDRLSQEVVALLPIPIKTPGHEVLTRIQPAAHDYERQFEDGLIEDVINMAKSGGRAALGRDDVLKAVEEQRVEMLIAPWPLTDEYLLHTLPEKMLHSSAELELVHGDAAERLNAEGGLAARLYYAL